MGSNHVIACVCVSVSFCLSQSLTLPVISDSAELFLSPSLSLPLYSNHVWPYLEELSCVYVFQKRIAQHFR